MGKLIEKYNKTFEESLDKESKVKPVEEDIYKIYKDSLSKKGVLEVTFDIANDEGDLSVYDENGIQIILKEEELKKTNPYYSKNIKSKFIGLVMRVRAYQIDEKNKYVYVSSAVNQQDIKGGVIKEIFQELAAGKHPIMYGDVMSVNNRYVVVNILHRNVLGFINVADWSPSYTRYLKSAVKSGDLVKFEVVKQAKKEKGKDFAFQLSRKNVVENPWNLIPEIKVGSDILVKCIDKPIDKTYFWGVSGVTPGVEIMCDLNANLTIMNSVTYKCKVRTFNRIEHKFQVVPYQIIESGIGTIENIKFVTGKKIRKEV